MAKEKETCPCGCKRKLSRATINRHLGGKGPGTLALYVLLENTRALQRRGKKSNAGYSTKKVLLGRSPQHSRKRSVKQKTSPDPPEDLLAGEVVVPPDDADIPMNEPMPTVETTDTLPDQGHVLSTTRRSNRVAAKLVQVQQLRWGAGHIEPTREEEEEEVGGVDMYEGNSPDPEDDEEEEDWDEDDWQNVTSAAPGQEGIPTWDLLGEGFLKEASELDGTSLDDDDKAFLRAYQYKLDENLTEKAFNKLPYVFPSASVKTLKRTEGRVQLLSGFKPIRYERCINSCVCYTGPYEDLETCPVCSTERKNTNGKPHAYFTYLPIIPRLRAMVANASYASKMQYRASYKYTSSRMQDIFDGTNYRTLLESNITIGDETLASHFFSDSRDIALGVSTDGFTPFNARDKTAWPIIIFNYNLPPEERFHKDNIISVGVIPGPKKPADADSYLWPLVQELLQLSIGLTAFDALTKTLFLLHAFLIVVFGDIPAVSMMMRMKGHNSKHPCRMCMIKGVRNDVLKTLYVPLNRQRFPDTVMPRNYDPAALPLRNHNEFMHQAQQVQYALTAAESERLAQKYGVKGIPLLSVLSSLLFPTSFPYDFMHLIWANLIPNLILLWTGQFKHLDHSEENYVFAKSVWEAIGEATTEAGKTIPTAFGTRIPNIALEKRPLTAEMRSVWTVYLAPALLRGRFRQELYYKHFLALVRLLKLCLEFELSMGQVDELEAGFNTWVMEYERLYYKHDPLRVATCPITVHALLHIAPSIRAMGPVWAYWAFPMERYCGTLGPIIKSRRHPYKSIDHYVTAYAQLTQTKLLYNLHQELSFKRPPIHKHDFSLSWYPSYILTSPKRTSVLKPAVWEKFTAAIATRFTMEVKDIRKFFPKPLEVTEYGRLRRLGGGDAIQARELVAPSVDGRDMSFVRYQLLVDIYAHIKRRKPQFKLRDFFGQLLRIFVVKIPDELQGADIEEENGEREREDAEMMVSQSTPTHWIYAVIQSVKVSEEDRFGIRYYKEMGPVMVVDLNVVQCVVGRIRDRNQWAIIDRSVSLAPTNHGW